MNVIRGVVFDFGGVISLPMDPALYAQVKALAGWSAEALHAGWRRHRSGMDADVISVQELYRRMAADEGRVFAEETVEALALADFNAWSRPNPETLAWAQRLKASGYAIGILTNMPTDFLPWFDRCAAAFRALADAEVVSGAEGIVKPNAVIYQLMAQRLALPPEALFFLDDTQANVEAARACGWYAHRFVDVPGAMAALREIEA